MKIGFTGTQKGMTRLQKEALVVVLVEEEEKEFIGEFHHGDCIGADEEAHKIVGGKGGDQLVGQFLVKIVVHPPSNPTKRAYCVGTEMKDHRPYLVRNRDIVDQTDMLIAAPQSEKEEVRSGTWYTVRYARKKKKRVVLILPNGEIK
jgi:hypothetical protein